MDNILEERDPSYDAMLGQMVGRIKSKPGGKSEMGEVSFMETIFSPFVEWLLVQKGYLSWCNVCLSISMFTP